EIGPEKVVEVYHAKHGMKGFVVIDNTAFGPGKGGIRMTPTVTVEEVQNLARAMTLKNSLAELPFGGAKSGIVADPRKITPKAKEDIVKAFAEALKCVSPNEYVAAPDINMGEKEMRIYAETNSNMKSVTGKPKELGGLPHELGSTGYGVFLAAKIGAEYAGIDLKTAKIAIEGFGNVGSFVAKFLHEEGATVHAVSDINGTIYNPEGLDYERLVKVTKEKGTPFKYPDAQKLYDKELFELPVDVIITAAIPNVINSSNVEKVQAKLIVEGSNIPMRNHIERRLHEKGTWVIPDFVANAGGVISSYVEYLGGTEKEMFELVKEKIEKNTELVLKQAKEQEEYPRHVAREIAVERVKDQCRKCGKL
ncbi:Glu/Leu/Phe/Val dehydrogenase, partial [Candidatus Micrarchaeota archaeon]|nr:Glu/Leu/Phe/Val dehydrogenase [Candidatus Micrarchaeota archaeon]